MLWFGKSTKRWEYRFYGNQTHTLMICHTGLYVPQVPLLHILFLDIFPYTNLKPQDIPAEKEAENPTGMLMVPYSYDCNDFKFNVPTGFGSPTDFYDHVKGAFDTLYEEGEEGAPKMMTIATHCRCMGKPARFAALKKLVEYISSKEGVWVATRTEIAEHFREKFPYEKGSLVPGRKRAEEVRVQNAWPSHLEAPVA